MTMEADFMGMMDDFIVYLQARGREWGLVEPELFAEAVWCGLPEYCRRYGPPTVFSPRFQVYLQEVATRFDRMN